MKFFNKTLMVFLSASLLTSSVFGAKMTQLEADFRNKTITSQEFLDRVLRSYNRIDEMKVLTPELCDLIQTRRAEEDKAKKDQPKPVYTWKQTAWTAGKYTTYLLGASLVGYGLYKADNTDKAKAVGSWLVNQGKATGEYIRNTAAFLFMSNIFNSTTNAASNWWNRAEIAQQAAKQKEAEEQAELAKQKEAEEQAELAKQKEQADRLAKTNKLIEESFNQA